MYYNTTLASWIVQSLRKEDKTLRQQLNRNSPLGRIEWKYEEEENEDNYCPIDVKVKNRELLTFTKCKNGEFTCDSGHCVDNIRYFLIVIQM